VDIFRAEAGPALRIVPDPDEVMAVRWVGLPELAEEVAAHPDRFTPWLRIYLAEHAAAIFGDLVRA
jgi:isopentenyl-diphosphate Delta-isomerase